MLGNLGLPRGFPNILLLSSKTFARICSHSNTRLGGNVYVPSVDCLDFFLVAILLFTVSHRHPNFLDPAQSNLCCSCHWWNQLTSFMSLFPLAYKEVEKSCITLIHK